MSIYGIKINTYKYRLTIDQQKFMFAALQQTMELKLGCLNLRCFKCCEETEMPLSDKDVKRLEKLGYKSDEFSIKKDGIRVLRNVNGRCYFLKDGKCIIYDSRPTGCRLYPIVYDVNKKRATVDDFCPLAREIPIWKVKKLEKVLFKHIYEIYGYLP